jgi:hypothetical protein
MQLNVYIYMLNILSKKVFQVITCWKEELGFFPKAPFSLLSQAKRKLLEEEDKPAGFPLPPIIFSCFSFLFLMSFSLCERTHFYLKFSLDLLGVSKITRKPELERENRGPGSGTRFLLGF